MDKGDNKSPMKVNEGDPYLNCYGELKSFLERTVQCSNRLGKSLILFDKINKSKDVPYSENHEYVEKLARQVSTIIRKYLEPKYYKMISNKKIMFSFESYE